MTYSADELAALDAIMQETNRRERAHGGTDHRANQACAECRAIFDSEPHDSGITEEDAHEWASEVGA